MRRAIGLGVLAACGLGACSGWTPSRPFERDAPPVRQAILALDAGDATAAANTLEEYLSTGPCKDGNIGAPGLVHLRADGTFDLGLSLFGIGEKYGRRFGEEESASSSPSGPPGQSGGASEASKALRHAQVLCARSLVQLVAGNADAPSEFRLRARYLDGNLSFLDGEYEEAVRAYDQALAIAPGQVDGGDSVARDAAWNRAIALERLEEKKDAGNDASSDASGDSGARGDGGGSPGNDGGADGGGAPPDDEPDSGPDGSPPPPEPRDEPDGGPDGAAPPPALTGEDDRMLDQLEKAPTLQQEAAKHGKHRRVVIDK